MGLLSSMHEKLAATSDAEWTQTRQDYLMRSRWWLSKKHVTAGTLLLQTCQRSEKAAQGEHCSEATIIPCENANRVKVTGHHLPLHAVPAAKVRLASGSSVLFSASLTDEQFEALRHSDRRWATASTPPQTMIPAAWQRA